MSAFTTVEQVRQYYEHMRRLDPLGLTCIERPLSAIEVLLSQIDAKSPKRKLAKSAPLRVTAEQFRTIADSRIICTLLMTDKQGKYTPGMLAVVMEFDDARGRFTQRQTLRIVSHVWQALPGYDADTIVIALQPVEQCP